MISFQSKLIKCLCWSICAISSNNHSCLQLRSQYSTVSISQISKYEARIVPVERAKPLKDYLISSFAPESEVSGRSLPSSSLGCIVES